MLRIYDVILAVLRDLRPVLVQIELRDPSLGKQLRRCAASMALNTAEGSGCRGGTRRQRYLDALGSARESAACLDTADALGYCALDAALRDRIERVAATLVRNVR